MSIPNTRAPERRPVHPGEMLREEFLPETVDLWDVARGLKREIQHIRPLRVA